MTPIEYGIFGEGSHISTNQKRENTVFSLLIGLSISYSNTSLSFQLSEYGVSPQLTNRIALSSDIDTILPLHC